MRRLPITILLTFLFFSAGLLFTMARIDSHGYWPLTHTSLDIQFMKRVISQYATENHRIPRSAEELQELATAGEDGVLGIRRLPHDFWERAFVYKAVDLKSLNFEFYSAGPDGLDNNGGGDDVIGGKKAYQCELYGACKTLEDHVNFACGIGALLSILVGIGLAVRSLISWAKRNFVRATK